MEAAPLPGIGFPCEEQDIPEWEDDQKLAFEKDSLGFYLTSHPLQPFRRDMPRERNYALSMLAESWLRAGNPAPAGFRQGNARAAKAIPHW